jgi:TonB family protein
MKLATLHCVTTCVLLWVSMAGGALAAEATLTQDQVKALQTALKADLSDGPAAKSKDAVDFRGRTAAQDIADWVSAADTKQRLDGFLATSENDETARRNAATILVDQIRRMRLIDAYWKSWPMLKRERDLWDQWAQLVTPQSVATDSIQRVKDREAGFAKTYVPTADPAVLDADLQSLLKLYNHERLSLAKEANAKLATMNGRLPSRTRQSPCPAASPADSTDTRPTRPVAVTSQPSVADYYPDDVRRSESSGRVLLKLTIDEAGCAKKFDVLESTGDPLLDDAALRFAEAMRFKPAFADGKPAQTSVRLPVMFSLDN